MPSFIEVCSGCGGLSYGFIKSGFDVLLLNEIDKTCCETLKKNHKNIEIHNDDIKKLNLKKYKNKVDVLAGGIPCQSFSHAGMREGLDDERGKLIYEFNRLIKECEPKIFLIENVKGMITHNNGETFLQIIDLLEKDKKYKTFYKVLNSFDYEVPQKRERLIIIGVKKTINKNFEFPDKNNNRIVLKDVLTDVPKSIGIEYPEKKKKLFKLIPQGGCWINLPENLQKEYMGEKTFSAGGGKRGILRKLHMDEPSLTLLTSPTQKQTERCHPIENRPLTVREYARIQTFPDEYVFCGSIIKQYKQIGNAVPVNLSYKIAEKIKEFLL